MKIKTRNSLLTTLFLFTLILFSSCKKDGDGGTPTPGPGEERQRVTSMNILFEPEGKGQSVSVTYTGLDGQSPTGDALVLKANTAYTATVKLFDGNNEVTAAVRDKGTNYEFFYTAATANIQFTKTDRDSAGRPIGLTNSILTGAPSAGTLRVVLKHQPGAKTASSSVNTGTTAFDVTINTTIQ